MQFDGTVKSRQMITVLDKKKDNSTTSAWQKKKSEKRYKMPEPIKTTNEYTDTFYVHYVSCGWRSSEVDEDIWGLIAFWIKTFAEETMRITSLEVTLKVIW